VTPPVANRALDFHESEVLAVRHEGKDSIVHLEAYLHTTEGRPGKDPGTGWLQEAQLIIGEGRVSRQCDALWILEGRLEVDGEIYSGLLPLPFERAGLVRLELSGAEGTLAITGRGARLVLLGEPRLIEEPADRGD
jgi:hypothetical protein